MEKCVFCGNDANTKDHIPSKGLYKGTTPEPHPILVPSCWGCNNSLSSDEEFFRFLIAGMTYDRSPEAEKIIKGAVGRSIKRKPLLAERMLRKMKPIDFYSKEGNFVGKKILINYSDDDKRVINVLNKYIKGLFFNKFGKNISSGYDIFHYPIKINFLNSIVKDFGGFPRQKVIENIFDYGSRSDADNRSSVWLLCFFNTPVFISFVFHKEISELHQINKKLEEHTNVKSGKDLILENWGDIFL